MVQSEIEAKLVEHDLQILACIRLAGPRRRRGNNARTVLAGLLVKAHGERAGALEDVEELAERDVEQRRDDAYRTSGRARARP